MFCRLAQRSRTLFFSQLRHYNLEVTQHNEPLNNFQQKILRVAIIGTPNAGKSTFINYLMDRKVCPTSNKVHTTRKKSTAIFTSNDSQIIFLDTPGLVNEREIKIHKLEATFVKDPKYSLKDADIIGVIHDVSNTWTREKLDIKVINLLEEYINVPSFLVLNKIDTLKSKRKLLDITRILTENCLNGKAIKYNRPIRGEMKGWKHFKEIFMVSALTGDGLDSVRNYLIDNSYPNKWLYPSEVWTDQSRETIILNTVMATFLDFLPQEIPYKLKPVIEMCEENVNAITTVVLVKGPSERICKLVAGQGDGRLRQVTEVVQSDLQNVFQKQVRVKLVLVDNK